MTSSRLPLVRRAVAGAGFLVALLAVSADDPRLAWGAIALLLASLGFRLLQRPQPKVLDTAVGHSPTQAEAVHEDGPG